MSAGFKTNDDVFSVREPMWHNLGHVLDEYPTVQEAKKLVHDWEPVPTPLYRQVPGFNEQGEPEVRYEEAPGYVAQERSDDGSLIGITSTTYVTVTNQDVYDVAETIQTGGDGSVTDVMLETGGSLDGGARVWLMLRLNEPIYITGDPNGAVLPYYLLQNHHNATGAFKGSAVDVRVVCQNTLRAADMSSQIRGTEFAFSHTKNIAGRVEEAREALAGWRESIEDFRLLAEHLVTQKISPEGVQGFVERFIPAPLSFMTSDRVKNNIEEARGAFMEVYNSATLEGIQGTAWGLLQASSEYSEHIRKAKSMESRFKRAMLNRNQIITDAHALVLEAVGA